MGYKAKMIISPSGKLYSLFDTKTSEHSEHKNGNLLGVCSNRNAIFLLKPHKTSQTAKVGTESLQNLQSSRFGVEIAYA